LGSALGDFSWLAVCPSSLSLFAVDTKLGTPSGTTIVDMDNQMILKVNLNDLPGEQKALIEQATKEFREKCLLSYIGRVIQSFRRLHYQGSTCMGRAI
jgi:hypothetical protein